MARAIGYIRVSTSGQAEDGVSLEMQEARVRAWAELNGYEFGGCFSDAGISGMRTDRPGLTQALSASGRGDALVVYSLSRFGRSTKAVLEGVEVMERRGVDLVSLSERIDTTTAAGRMVFRMIAVLNEFERDQVAERTSSALQHLKRQGRRYGEIPYGKRLADDGSLEDHPGEVEIVTTVWKLRSEGFSFGRIARRLAELGFTPRGANGAWHPQTVKNIAISGSHPR